MARGWTWATGSPRERAETIRGHAYGSRPLAEYHLRKLFLLTEDGLSKILKGDDWRPEYEQAAVNEVEH